MRKSRGAVFFLLNETKDCAHYNNMHPMPRSLLRVFLLFLLLLFLPLCLELLPVSEVGIAALQHGLDGGEDFYEQVVAGETDAHDEAHLVTAQQQLVGVQVQERCVVPLFKLDI